MTARGRDRSDSRTCWSWDEITTHGTLLQTTVQLQPDIERPPTSCPAVQPEYIIVWPQWSSVERRLFEATEERHAQFRPDADEFSGRSGSAVDERDDVLVAGQDDDRLVVPNRTLAACVREISVTVEGGLDDPYCLQYDGRVTWWPADPLTSRRSGHYCRRSSEGLHRI